MGVALALLLHLRIDQRRVRHEETRAQHDEAHERDEPVEARDARGDVELVVVLRDAGAVAPLSGFSAHVRVRREIPLPVHVHGDEQVEEDAHRDAVH